MVDIVKELCAAVAKSCDVKVLPWRRAFDEVDAGTMDGLFPILETAERREKYHVIPPIVQTAYVFLTVTESSWSYTGPASLDGKTIAVYGPSGSATEAQNLARQTHSARVEMEVSMETMLRKLAAGRYGPNGVGFITREVAAQLLTKMNIKTLKAAGASKEISFTVALSRKTISADMAKRLEDALQGLKNSGRIKSILANYQLQSAD